MANAQINGGFKVIKTSARKTYVGINNLFFIRGCRDMYGNEGGVGGAACKSKTPKAKTGIITAMSEHIKGCKYYEDGKYKEAIEAFNKALKVSSEYAEVFNGLGLAYIELGNFKRRPEAYKGEREKAKGDFDNAIEDFKEAIRLDQNYAEAFNNLGRAYLTRGEKGDVEQAIENYDIAIGINPDYADAFNNRSIAYYIKGDLKQSREDHNKALKLKQQTSKLARRG